MAKVVSKQLNTAQRRYDLVIEDDFGHQSHIQVHLAFDSCPQCGRPYPLNKPADPANIAGGADEVTLHELDVDKLASEVCSMTDQITDHVARKMRKDGSDISHYRGKDRVTVAHPSGD